MNSFLIAAPSSGAGKTLLTLGLLRAFRKAGIEITSAKAGPDYIDPAFHAAATGKSSINLDPWAMRASLLQSLASETLQRSEMMIVEGMMGLFDGAADGSSSAADLAEFLRLPVVLVVDVSSMSFSVAALVKGFRDHRKALNFAGVILNKVGSARHEKMLRDALDADGVTIFGAVYRNTELAMPSRHLGLVQACEYEALETFISHAADHVEKHCDMTALSALTCEAISRSDASYLPPLGQRIAIARDQAFAFCYPHLLDGWQKAGAEISLFSPLADEAPDKSADAVFLPGGYPELHATTLSNASRFKIGLAAASKQGALVYGECGGYMVLGDTIVDADGNGHAMTGLLKLETSFEKRKLHLGYRQLKTDRFVMGNDLRGHEFHYTSVIREEGTPLFEASDALGVSIGKVGLRYQNVMGSYMHIIDRVA